MKLLFVADPLDALHVRIGVEHEFVFERAARMVAHDRIAERADVAAAPE